MVWQLNVLRERERETGEAGRQDRGRRPDYYYTSHCAGRKGRAIGKGEEREKHDHQQTHVIEVVWQLILQRHSNTMQHTHRQCTCTCIYYGCIHAVTYSDDIQYVYVRMK